MSATEPFQPVREDGRPYWQVIYDDLVARIEQGDLEIGDIVTHGEFSRLLDGILHYQPVAKAAQQLRERHNRNLMTVRGVGYKLVAGMEMVSQAKSHQRRARREFDKGKHVVKYVDRALLSPDERMTATQMEKALGVLANYAKMTAVKVEEHEQEIELLKSAKAESNARHSSTEEEMAEMRRRLDDLEQN